MIIGFANLGKLIQETHIPMWMALCLKNLSDEEETDAPPAKRPMMADINPGITERLSKDLTFDDEKGPTDQLSRPNSQLWFTNFYAMQNQTKRN